MFLVFHQSNRVSAIKCMLLYNRHISIFMFLQPSVYSLLSMGFFVAAMYA